METLDALALATLPEDALIARLASRYRSSDVHDAADPDASTALRWVRKIYGPLFPHEDEVRLGRALADEIRTQFQIALHRDSPEPPRKKSTGDRKSVIAKEILGPPARHLSKKLRCVDSYADIEISRGLIVGLIVGNELAGHSGLLVFRAPGARRVQTYWVGAQDLPAEGPSRDQLNHPACWNLDQALQWLVTPAVRALLDRGLRVEREWGKTRNRIYYPDGRTSTLPWRKRA